MSEAAVLSVLVKKGATVSVPYGDNARYDFVVDYRDGSLSRVQVKTGRYATSGNKAGCVVANLYSTHTKTGAKSRYSPEQVDFYMIYCPGLDKVYQLPVGEFTTWNAWLRVDEPKRRNPGSVIRWAKDYELQ